MTASSIVAGVDTHKDTHVAAALNLQGVVLGVETFPANPAGYRRLHRWLETFGPITVAGVEGTGTYGAGLARHLNNAGVQVREIDRPNRQHRRREGKSDPIDAVAAARAALAGEGSTPKNRDGNVEAIRVLRVARRSARAECTRSISQMKAIVSTAPDELRELLRHLNTRHLVTTCRGLRPTGPVTSMSATKTALRELAGRIQHLEAEITRLDELLEPLVQLVAPTLLDQPGIGPDTAGALLVEDARSRARRSRRSISAVLDEALQRLPRDDDPASESDAWELPAGDELVGQRSRDAEEVPGLSHGQRQSGPLHGHSSIDICSTREGRFGTGKRVECGDLASAWSLWVGQGGRAVRSPPGRRPDQWTEQTTERSAEHAARWCSSTARAP
jgi:transposase